MIDIREYFDELETTEDHMGYYYSVQDAAIIVILGSICGLKNVSQIHQWAKNERIMKLEYVEDDDLRQDMLCAVTKEKKQGSL